MRKSITIAGLIMLLIAGINPVFAGRYYIPEIGRWTTPDPKASNYPNWSPYVYCFNNPLKFIDPNGEEPNKSQTIAPREFITYLQNIYKNNPKETLTYLGTYTTLGGADPSHKRYIYTSKGGWIDLVHFFNVAAELDKLSGMNKIGAYFFGESKLWDKTEQVENEQQTKGSVGTAWSYEDAPSNYFGYLFWKYYYDSSGDLILQIIKFLKEYCATSPNQAPNWEKMWSKENWKERQFPQNKTFNPMFTSDPDENEDDWWSDYDPSKR